VQIFYITNHLFFYHDICQILHYKKTALKYSHYVNELGIKITDLLIFYIMPIHICPFNIISYKIVIGIEY